MGWFESSQVGNPVGVEVNGTTKGMGAASQFFPTHMDPVHGLLCLVHPQLHTLIMSSHLRKKLSLGALSCSSKF